MRIKMVFLLLALTVTAICVARQPLSFMGDFRGRYVVDEIVGYADISGGEPTARRLLGQVLVISPNAIDFDGDHCEPNSGFRIKRIKTAPILKNYYGVTLRETGLPARTLLLDSNNCVAVFQMNKYRVVLGSDGVVVRAIRDEIQQPEKRAVQPSK